jgi:crotonobetainyl-CoA:carnitine CoA-transferase CaiB-like acyl-CoA transferase
VSHAQNNAGALAGLKVVDFTQALAGPYCTMILADLGADMLKVESLQGDLIRKVGPYPKDDRMRAYGGYFQSINRNKRSIAVDLKRPEGREIALSLVRRADVVVENFRAGVMDRFGLGYETLHEVNPRLVYACVRGFGDPRSGTSRYTDWPAYDVVSQAMGGLMGVTGPGPEQPMKAGCAVGDIVPAMFLAIGVLAAVRHAQLTGEGQFVDVGMYDAVLALCERIIYQYSVLGQIPKPEGNSITFLCPFDAFPARDGWVTIAAPGENHWKILCEAIGRPELAADPNFATNPARVRHADQVRALLREWTAARTRREILAALGGKVPCGAVHTVKDIFEDEHPAARAMLATIDHPGLTRRVTIAAPPVKMSATPAAVRTRAPLLGESTVEVMERLGYAAEQIQALARDGVIATASAQPPPARTNESKPGHNG